MTGPTKGALFRGMKLVNYLAESFAWFGSGSGKNDGSVRQSGTNSIVTPLLQNNTKAIIRQNQYSITR